MTGIARTILLVASASALSVSLVAARSVLAKSTSSLSAPPPRFADFGHLPPPNEFHPAGTFRLSQDYPATETAIDPAVTKTLAIDVEAILAENDKAALRWRMTIPAATGRSAGHIIGTNVLVFVPGEAISNDQSGGTMTD